MRTTHFLLARFRANCDEALRLTTLAEKSPLFTHTSCLHIYEAAYLLIFCAWESILEESFVRFLCGYHNGSGAQSLAAGKILSADLALARAELFGNQTYLLWHSPHYSIKRSKKWFVNGTHESVVGSAAVDIQDFASIRHYIAHRSKDSSQQFDTAARRLSGAGVLGTRAGRFLRQGTIDPQTGLRVRWIDRIYSDLDSYAKQIVT